MLSVWGTEKPPPLACKREPRPPLAPLPAPEGPSWGGAYIERMGATSSREAIRMPISQMQAVSRRAQVGSPFALPWPKICRESAEGGLG